MSANNNTLAIFYLSFIFFYVYTLILMLFHLRCFDFRSITQYGAGKEKKKTKRYIHKYISHKSKHVRTYIYKHNDEENIKGSQEEKKSITGRKKLWGELLSDIRTNKFSIIFLFSLLPAVCLNTIWHIHPILQQASFFKRMKQGKNFKKKNSIKQLRKENFRFLSSFYFITNWKWGRGNEMWLVGMQQMSFLMLPLPKMWESESESRGEERRRQEEYQWCIGKTKEPTYAFKKMKKKIVAHSMKCVFLSHFLSSSSLLVYTWIKRKFCVYIFSTPLALSPYLSTSSTSYLFILLIA